MTSVVFVPNGVVCLRVSVISKCRAIREGVVVHYISSGLYLALLGLLIPLVAGVKLIVSRALPIGCRKLIHPVYTGV